MKPAYFDSIKSRLSACVDHDSVCRRCGYQQECIWKDKPAAMAASMLALLSHTEPRVLAWAELDEICEGEDGTALYLEVLGDPALYVASAYVNVTDCKKQITAGDARLEALMEINPEMFSASCYGSTWRLWDGKPSDEKRSACGWM